jgi:hypothetical protein
MVNFYSKWIVNSSFFFEELLCATMRLKLLRVKGQGTKKEVCFAYRMLNFHIFFQILLFLMVLYDAISNVTTPI